jgi:hypothetical protein
MNPLVKLPVRERELPAPAREAIRSVLLDEVRAGGRPARPVLLTRGRVLVAAAAAALLAAQVWPLPGDQPHLVAWTAHPEELDDATAAEIARMCVREPPDQVRRTSPDAPADFTPPQDGWEPAVVDRRGELAMVLLTGDGYYRFCGYAGLGDNLRYTHGGGGMGRINLLPEGEVASAEGWDASRARHDLDPSGLTWYETGTGKVFGQVAPHVARVDVTLSDGTEVEASVSDGWYVAFWPGSSRRILAWTRADVPEPVAVRSYDSSGEVLDHMKIQRWPSRSSTR